MPRVSVPRHMIRDGSLPAVCVVCGKEASYRRFPGVTSPSLAWVLFSPLIGLLAFWAYIIVSSFGDKHQSNGLPFCGRHRAYWPRRAWFIIGGFVILIGLGTAAGLLTEYTAAGKKGELNAVFGLVLGCPLLVFLPTFLIVHLSAMRPVGRSPTSLVLSGASRNFVQAVERT